MAKHWQERIKKTVKSLGRYSVSSRQLFLNARSRISNLLRKSAYWSAVFVFGITLGVTIMHLMGVPVFEVAYAGAWQWIFGIFGTVLYYLFIAPIGAAAAIVAFILQIVINYPHGDFWNFAGSSGSGRDSGGFVNVSAVITGWALVRDISNVFFSLILIIIALATVLKIEAYSWKQMVPKLVLMAVLINFSKSIAGIFTDFATVAMATFGGSFGKSFGTGLIGAFGLPGLTDLAPKEEGNDVKSATNDTSPVGVMLAYIAAAVMVLVFFVVMVIFTLTLIFRIIMLWFLIVLSPLAYITRILPQTQKYSSQWWEMFGRYVLVGPLVTFFLWLSLSIAFGTGDVSTSGSDPVASGNKLGQGVGTQLGPEQLAQLQASGQSLPPTFEQNAANPNVMANFMIALMMLMASLKIINQMAAEFGSTLGKVEGATWAAGATLFAYSGRLAQQVGSGIGGNTEENSWLSRKAFNLSKVWGGGAIGKLLTFAGTTVLDPAEFGKGVLKGLSESSAAKKAMARQNAQATLADMRGENKVAGKEGPGITSKLMGVLAGTGLDGKHVFDRYLSGGGVIRIAKKALRRGKFAEIDSIAETADDLDESVKKSGLRYTEEEYIKAKEDLANYHRAKQRMQKDIKELGTDPSAVGLDFSQDWAKAVGSRILENLQSERAVLAGAGNVGEADKVKTQIDWLEAAIKTGSSVSAGQLINDFAGSAENTDAHNQRKKENTEIIKNAFNGQRGELARLSGGLMLGMKETGAKVGFDKISGAVKITDPNAATHPFITQKDRDDLLSKAKAERAKEYRLRNEQGALSAGLSYAARTEKARLVGEELSKIQDIMNSDELMMYLDRAVQEKNRYMHEAVLRRVTQNGDENEIFQQRMAHLGPAARSDAEGMHNYRKLIMENTFGMSAGDAMTSMNDITYLAEGIGHLGVARAYTMKGGAWKQQSEPDRVNLVTGEKRKMSPNKWLDWNRLGWGYEDHDRQFHLSEHGRKLLQSGGEDMADERMWIRFNPNAKAYLSHPDVVRDLRASGVSERFLGKLESYWSSTAKYSASANAPMRAGASRLSRVA